MWKAVMRKLGFGSVVTKPAKLSLAWADLSKQEVEALVTPADWTMIMGGGLDGAVHEAAGPELEAFTRKHGMRLEQGQVKSTPGFGTKAKWILHARAPVYDPLLAEECMRLLGECVQGCFDEAKLLGAESMAIPLLGMGATAWPVEIAAQTVAKALAKAAKDPGSLRTVKVCAFDKDGFEALGRRMGMAGVVEGDPSAFAYRLGYGMVRPSQGVEALAAAA